jgi:hypothetical protein
MHHELKGIMRNTALSCNKSCYVWLTKLCLKTRYIHVNIKAITALIRFSLPDSALFTLGCGSLCSHLYLRARATYI